jgi:hypothetical protein
MESLPLFYVREHEDFTPRREGAKKKFFPGISLRLRALA